MLITPAGQGDLRARVVRCLFARRRQLALFVLPALQQVCSCTIIGGRGCMLDDCKLFYRCFASC